MPYAGRKLSTSALNACLCLEQYDRFLENLPGDNDVVLNVFYCGFGSFLASVSPIIRRLRGFATILRALDQALDRARTETSTTICFEFRMFSKRSLRLLRASY